MTKVIYPFAYLLTFSVVLMQTTAYPSTKETEVTYFAAALEYEPYKEWDPVEHGFVVLRENANNIAYYATIARQQGADIMVTPEYGLQGLDMDYSYFKTYNQYIPDKGQAVSLCDEGAFPEFNDAMEILSCAARNNSMYIVAGLSEMYPCNEEAISVSPIWGRYTVDEECPTSGYFFYNTQVVFDRTGTVIAKHHKFHMYLEPEYTPGSGDSSEAVFETDFGVTFSLQICFEILNESPGYYNVKFQGIKDVVMGTAWVDTLPFIPSSPIMEGWSRLMGANLIVAGYHWPENTKLGSGIYNAYKGRAPVYTYDKDSGSKVVVSSVTTKLTLPIPSSPKTNIAQIQTNHITDRETNNIVLKENETRDGRYHTFYYLDLSPFESVLLNSTTVGEEGQASVCSTDGELCCDLSYQYTGDLFYRLFADSGIIDAAGGDIYFPLAIQICGVVWCVDKYNISSCGLANIELPEPDTFGPFEVTGTFQAELVIPVSIDRDIMLVDHQDLEFYQGLDTYTLSSSVPISNIHTLAFFARWISKDPLYYNNTVSMFS